MWTATPVKAERIGGRLDCTCIFAPGEGEQGASTPEHVFGATLAEVEQQAERRARELTGSGTDELKKLLSVLNQPFNFTPPTPPDPTPRELFSADVTLLERMAHAAELGITGLDVAAQLSKVQKALDLNPDWIDAF